MRVNTVKAKVYSLDPTKKHLIVFDARVITKEDARRATQALGVEGVAIVVEANPGSVVKVIEEG